MDDLNIYGVDTEYSGRKPHRAKPLSVPRLYFLSFFIFEAAHERGKRLDLTGKKISS